ncbi:hypothetical protein [Trichococcus paludicola]|uniref:hypothetical protein n=1 Tax=Trichococcus paludicola TaxID=2052942 RepID=UPI00131B579D|nr:hypothetical protein [Trichococcus paludicola]
MTFITIVSFLITSTFVKTNAEMKVGFPQKAELANITPIAFIPVRIMTPSNAGSMIPSGKCRNI